MTTKTTDRDKTQGTITASLGKDLITVMDHHCGNNDISRSQFVRAAVIDRLKRAGENLRGISISPPSRKGKGGRASYRNLDTSPEASVPNYGPINVGSNSFSIGHNSDVEVDGATPAPSKPKTKRKKKKNV